MNATLFDFDNKSKESTKLTVDLSTEEGQAKFERFFYDMKEIAAYVAFCKRVDKEYGKSTERLIQEMEE